MDTPYIIAILVVCHLICATLFQWMDTGETKDHPAECVSVGSIAYNLFVATLWPIWLFGIIAYSIHLLFEQHPRVVHRLNPFNWVIWCPKDTKPDQS